MPELGTYGSVRGALSNRCLYRDPNSATGCTRAGTPTGTNQQTIGRAGQAA